MKCVFIVIAELEWVIFTLTTDDQHNENGFEIIHQEMLFATGKTRVTNFPQKSFPHF